jgi:serine/threonine-protein kinase
MADPVTREDRVSALAEDFLARHRQGLKPSFESYAAAHPELADEIRRLFPALLMMEELKPGSGDATGSFDGAAVVVSGARLQRLGDFRILREVGRGGMGVVYEAEQESLGRRVALKVLAAPALQDPARVRRFEREARAAAKLHHTNIVPVFGVGAQEGLHYYVMQFIQGLGLDDVIAELKRLRSTGAGAAEAPARDLPIAPDAPPTAAGIARSLVTEGFVLAQRSAGETSTTETAASGDPGPPVAPAPAAAPDPSSLVLLGPSGLSSGSSHDARYWRGVARIGLQVARALEYAHTQGIFHRDVKPSNLLLDVQGTAWVADFGLAKAGEGEDLTHTGDIVGTIRYMAPERFRGRCDARADVYGLGLTMYEMLALRPAFEQSDRQELMRQVMEQEPPRLRKLNPSVPRDLETVVHKATEKDPAARYPTAAALAEDLALFLDGKPVRARAAGTLERFWKWAKRRPAVAALLAGLILAVLTGLAAVTWQWRRSVAARNDALAARDEARRTLKMANEAVSTYFTQVSEEQLLNEPGMQPLRKKLLEQAVPYYRAFAAQRRDDPALRLDLASTYLRWGSIASDIGANEEAETNLQAAAAQFQDILRYEPANVEAMIGLAKAHQALAQQWLFHGRLAEGRREADHAIASWTLVLANHPNDGVVRRMLGRSYDLMSLGYVYTGDPAAAVPFSQRAVAVLKQRVDDAPGDTEAKRRLAVAYSNLAVALLGSGWLIETEEAVSQAVDLLQSLCEREPNSMSLRADLCRTQGGRGKVRLHNGTVRAAEEDLTAALRISQRLVRDNPSVSDYRTVLANAEVYLATVHAIHGRTARAKQVLDDGFAQVRNLVRRNPRYKDAYFSLVEYYTLLAFLEGECGRVQPALESIRQGTDVLMQTHPEDSGDLDVSRIRFEAGIVSMLLDVKAARRTSDERITEIRELVEKRLRQTEKDPKNIWSASEAVSGYVALAERLLVSGAPADSLTLLSKAEAVLEAQLKRSPDSVLFRRLKVRLETLRGDVLRRLGNEAEAQAAAKQAVNAAESLSQEEPAVLFDLACARALETRLKPSAPGPPADAVKALEAAIKHGFDNTYKLESDDRLAPLRARQDFRALIDLLKKKTPMPGSP